MARRQSNVRARGWVSVSGRADEQAYEVEHSVLWVDGCVTKCLENDMELLAPSAC